MPAMKDQSYFLPDEERADQPSLAVLSLFYPPSLPRHLRKWLIKF